MRLYLNLLLVAMSHAVDYTHAEIVTHAHTHTHTHTHTRTLSDLKKPCTRQPGICNNHLHNYSYCDGSDMEPCTCI